MPNTISAIERALGDVLSDQYRFSVPDYQRPYAWDWEQAQELFDDICHATADAARLSQVGNLDPYFLGCVVIVKSENSPDSEIVDGQQRLATLTMLLCALRDSMPSDWFQSLNAMVRQDADPAKGLDAMERITIRKEDVAFFRSRVQEPGSLSSDRNGPRPQGETQRRLLDNAARLFELVQGLSDEQREVLARYLTTKCFLVLVATADTSSAVRIFSILHTRGLELSSTDIIKSQIAGKLSGTVRSVQMARWQEIEENLERDNFRLLFSHIYTIKTKERSRKSLEDVFVRDVLEGGRKCESFVDETLAPYADTFDKLVETEFDDAPEATRLLRSLRMVDNSDWIPPALHFVQSRRFSSCELVEFLNHLERLAYNMFVTGVYRDRRVRRYIEVLNEIEGGFDLNSSTSRLQLVSDEKSKMIEILRDDVNMKWARPVLLKLDGLPLDGIAHYQHGVVSIEHVLPQTPRECSEWMTLFPNEELRNQWTWKLANLVLLSRKKNSEANNREFAEKKHAYFASGRSVSFALTREVIDESEWTPKVLERRQEDLVGRLAEAWRLTD